MLTTEIELGGVKRRVPTPIVEIEWAEEDRLPFPFCLSVLGPPPACEHKHHVTVARGNVVLVDHGRTIEPPECLGQVPAATTEAHCEDEHYPGDVTVVPGRFRPALDKKPLTFAQPLPEEALADAQVTPAARLLAQDPRQAVPQVCLLGIPPAPGGQLRAVRVAGHRGSRRSHRADTGCPATRAWPPCGSGCRKRPKTCWPKAVSGRLRWTKRHARGCAGFCSGGRRGPICSPAAPRIGILWSR